jgi:hypothetical protein
LHDNQKLHRSPAAQNELDFMIFFGKLSQFNVGQRFSPVVRGQKRQNIT